MPTFLFCVLIAASWRPAVAGAPNVAPDDPVMTVQNFCAESSVKGGHCSTIITRAEFEKLTEALQPGMPPATRIAVANAYARNLRMAREAEKRGLDITERFTEAMRYARLQLLAQDLERLLRTEANDIHESDIAEFYTNNLAAFEVTTLARVFIPGVPSHLNSDPGLADARLRIAEDARARLLDGQEPDSVQDQIYALVGLPAAGSTALEGIRESMLPPRHASVMELKPGGVSEVFSDPGGGHFIYKMIEKTVTPLGKAAPEIMASMAAQRYRDQTAGLSGPVSLNDDYFNPPGAQWSGTPRKRRGTSPQSPASIARPSP